MRPVIARRKFACPVGTGHPGIPGRRNSGDDRAGRPLTRLSGAIPVPHLDENLDSLMNEHPGRGACPVAYEISNANTKGCEPSRVDSPAGIEDRRCRFRSTGVASLNRRPMADIPPGWKLRDSILSESATSNLTRRVVSSLPPAAAVDVTPGHRPSRCERHRLHGVSSGSGVSCCSVSSRESVDGAGLFTRRNTATTSSIGTTNSRLSASRSTGIAFFG